MTPPPDNVLLGKGKTFALTPEAQADGFSGFVSVDGEDWGDLCIVSGNSRHCWYAAPAGSSVAIHNGHYPDIKKHSPEKYEEILDRMEPVESTQEEMMKQPAVQWLNGKFVKPWTSPMPVPRFSEPPSPLETHVIVPEWKNRLVVTIKILDELTKQISAIAKDEAISP